MQMGSNPTGSLKSDVRRFPRKPFTRPIGVLVDGAYDIYAAVEIGEGGISFASDLDLPEGTRGVVSFQVPGFDFLNLRFSVKNAKPHSAKQERVYGCSFDDISSQKKRLLRAFISSILD